MGKLVGQHVAVVVENDVVGNVIVVFDNRQVLFDFVTPAQIRPLDVWRTPVGMQRISNDVMTSAPEKLVHFALAMA